MKKSILFLLFACLGLGLGQAYAGNCNFIIQAAIESGWSTGRYALEVKTQTGEGGTWEATTPAVWIIPDVKDKTSPLRQAFSAAHCPDTFEVMVYPRNKFPLAGATCITTLNCYSLFPIHKDTTLIFPSNFTSDHPAQIAIKH